MLEKLNIKIFADGADLESMKALSSNEYLSGFTTNPTLMRAAGVANYVEFAKKVLALITELPVSFEVLADDLPEMERQALEISSWGKNVNVKIPLMNTKGVWTDPILKSLSNKGVSVNVTALMTEKQVTRVMDSLNPSVPSIVSVFAGRVADTGKDPVPVMSGCLEILRDKSQCAQLLWASPREVFNIFEASRMGCDIITISHDMLRKLDNIGKDLDEFSRETVQMFFDDAQYAGYKI